MRKILVSIAPFVAVLVMAAAGFSLAHGAVGSSDSAVPGASIVPPDRMGPDGFPDDAQLADQPWNGTGADLIGGATPVTDCPEAWEFLTEPEVQNVYAATMGRALSADDYFADGCPSLETLKQSLEVARQARTAMGANQ